MTAMDQNSPPRLKSKKMNNSIDYQEINSMVDNDEEIRKHKLEIEKLKRDQQKQLEKYLKNEIGMILLLFLVIMILYRQRVCIG
jgi:uncharacterized membrane protein